jgi:hypothetical protein
MRNSQKSDTATVWFDILNSQSDATAKRLVSSSLQFGLSSASFVQQGPTLVPRPASAAGAGATQQKLAACKLCAVAHLPAVAEETPQLIPPSPLHQRELHALTPPTVSTAKGNTVRPTDDALTGGTALTGPGFPHGSLWLWMGRMSTQCFSDSVRMHMPKGGRGASAEILGDDSSAPLLPACQQLGKEHRNTD